MKIINLKQDTPEWKAWRKTSITATDAASIMGVNRYCSLKKLRQKKLGFFPEEEMNQFMLRGKNLEEEARQTFNDKEQLDMVPLIAESTEYPFLGASLDGISSCHKYILEIKCPQKKSMEEAKSGIVKPLYIAQMQAQLLVTGAEMCYYYCYDGIENYMIKVYPDKEWQMEYIPKAEEFWMSLVFDNEM
jgi:putative phage-type endonuclease